MTLSINDLSALKARCHQALSSGFGVGHADTYAAELSAELGQKFSGKATTAMLVDLISVVEAARAGKPVQAPEIPEVPEVPEVPEGEDVDAGEDEDEEASAKKSPSDLKKPKKKR